MDPAEEINSKVGDQFTLTVWVENIVKMKDLYLCIKWNGKYHPEEGGFYTTILKTKTADVVINEEVFPTDERQTSSLVVTSPDCGRYATAAETEGSVALYIVMKCTYPLINGTFWIMKITFTKCDPWYCGAQPDYTPKGDHDWVLENATTPIYFCDGYFSVACPDYPTYMMIGTDVLKEEAVFTFLPIPGDLDGSGHVDLTDIMVEVGFYGLTWPPYDPPYYDYYYDLNKDGVIDIYDVVIVAKNFCRTEP
jgi:hypothetical protein